MDRLPPVFAALGLVGLVTAAGLYLAGSGLDRFAVPVLAASVALLVYYAIERPQGIVRFFTGRTAKYGGNTLAMSVAFLAILALLNVLAARFTYRVDMTEAKDYTLSPQTIKILTDLKQPVKLTYFYQGGAGGKDAVQDVLKEFAQHTNKLETDYVDVQLRPALARQYGVDFPGTTVVESGTKRQTVMGTSEGDLISGILKVTRGEPKKAYVITGHGEPDPEGADQGGFSGVKQALEAENYKVDSLNLVSAAKVPSDAAFVVLAAPTSPLLPAETQALFDYLDGGGKALILADPAKMAGLAEIADRYGVELGKGVVVEAGQSLPQEPLAPVILGKGYLYSPITQNMPTMTVFPYATMARPKKADAASKYVATALAQTTERSWLAGDINNVSPSPSPSDVRGPVPIAVSVSSADSGSAAGSDASQKKSTRLVFIGDVLFATNGWLNLEGNRDFLVNSANWLAEEEDLISVRAKSSVDRRLMLTSGQMSLAMYSSILVLPLAVLGFGAWVVWGRR